MFVIALAMAIATAVPAMAQVDHFKTSDECLTAHERYQPRILHPRPMVAGEVLLPHPNGGCAEMTLPDRLGGRGWVWIPASSDVIVGGDGMRYAVCGNKIFGFIPAPAPAPVQQVAQIQAPAQPTPAPQVIYVMQPAPQQQEAPRPEYQPQPQQEYVTQQVVQQPIIEPEYVVYAEYVGPTMFYGGMEFSYGNYGGRQCYHRHGGGGHGQGGGVQNPPATGGTLPPGGGSGGGTNGPTGGTTQSRGAYVANGSRINGTNGLGNSAKSISNTSGYGTSNRNVSNTSGYGNNNANFRNNGFGNVGTNNNRPTVRPSISSNSGGNRPVGPVSGGQHSFGGGFNSGGNRPVGPVSGGQHSFGGGGFSSHGGGGGGFHGGGGHR